MKEVAYRLKLLFLGGVNIMPFQHSSMERVGCPRPSEVTGGEILEGVKGIPLKRTKTGTLG